MWARHDARSDDAGCEASAAAIAPPAAELVDQVVEFQPAPYPEPTRWHQTSDPRAC
jgi:hypothetical protein